MLTNPTVNKNALQCFIFINQYQMNRNCRHIKVNRRDLYTIEIAIHFHILSISIFYIYIYFTQHINMCECRLNKYYQLDLINFVAVGATSALCSAFK